MQVRITVWRKDGRMQSAVKELDSALTSLGIAELKPTFDHGLIAPVGAQHEQEWIER
jgi:hypothetical protein